MSSLSNPSETGAATDTNSETTLVSVRARWVAFVSIIVAGVIGASAGYNFAQLECGQQRCETSAALYLFVGALICSLGAATVAVLALRALPSWERPASSSSRPSR